MIYAYDSDYNKEVTYLLTYHYYKYKKLQRQILFRIYVNRLQYEFLTLE